MRMAAKKAKVARTQLEKMKKQQRAGKQFRGRKAWNDWKHLSLSYTMLSVIFFEWQLYYFASSFPPEELEILQQVGTILQKSCWDS